mmetsp:Transcript_122722/g.393004  ORF Transcript_122722/g.393004 Transcript_122722/m.393004 type:complete len:322 (+) Transcript_122722:1482-2447(+)
MILLPRPHPPGMARQRRWRRRRIARLLIRWLRSLDDLRADAQDLELVQRQAPQQLHERRRAAQLREDAACSEPDGKTLQGLCTRAQLHEATAKVGLEDRVVEVREGQIEAKLDKVILHLDRLGLLLRDEILVLQRIGRFRRRCGWPLLILARRRVLLRRRRRPLRILGGEAALGRRRRRPLWSIELSHIDGIPDARANRNARRRSPRHGGLRGLGHSLLCSSFRREQLRLNLRGRLLLRLGFLCSNLHRLLGSGLFCSGLFHGDPPDLSFGSTQCQCPGLLFRVHHEIVLAQRRRHRTDHIGAFQILDIVGQSLEQGLVHH